MYFELVDYITRRAIISKYLIHSNRISIYLCSYSFLPQNLVHFFTFCELFSPIVDIFERKKYSNVNESVYLVDVFTARVHLYNEHSLVIFSI